MSIHSESVAAPTEKAEVTSTPAASDADHALLEFRDGALLLAYRLSGNLADAEDILQDAYLKAVRSTVPQARGPELRNWFLRVTANAARDFRRIEHRRQERERSFAMEQSPLGSASPATPSEQAEMKQFLNAEVARLDEKYRAPICLHYEQGLTYDEASEILGVPASSLRVNASRGLQLLRQRLERPQRPLPAEALTALLAVGVGLTASSALAASVRQIVSTGSMAPAQAAAAKAASGLKIFSGQTGAHSSLVFGVLAAAAALAFSAVVTGVLLYRATRLPDDVVLNVPALAEPTPVEVPAPDEPTQAPGFVAAPDAIIAPVNYTPPPEVDALWKNAVELIPLLAPERDTVVGKWEMRNNSLHLLPHEYGRAMLNYVPPKEYDFRIDFTREDRGNGLMQIMPIDGACGSWRIHADGISYWGPNTKNPSIMRTTRLAVGTRHTSIVEVRSDSLTTWLDGKMILRLKRKDANVDGGSNWRLPDREQLGIGAHNTAIAFHWVAVRELSGPGQRLTTDAFAAALNEPHWTGARNLIPPAGAPASKTAGKWTIKDGALACEGARNTRFQFNYAPPDEYDVRVEFMRVEGERDVVLTLPACGRQMAWKIDAKGVTTMDIIDGKWEKGRLAMKTPNLIPNGVPHTTVVCVRKDGVRAYIDRRLMLAWKNDAANMPVENAEKPNSLAALSVGAVENTMLFTKVQVKELSGPGRELAPPVEAKDEF